MKFYGQLENACLEILSSDPASNVAGRIYYNSSTSRAMLDTGSLKQVLATNPMTAAGDIIIGGASGLPTRLAAGSSNQVLVISGGTPAWANVPPITTGGDLVYGNASGVPTRLPNGTSGQVLQSQGGTSAPQWTTLKAPTQTILTTTSGTYTPPSGVKALIVRCVGPGGGGGASTTCTASQCSAAGGGGGGGYVQALINPPAASYTYTVGQGGAGGVAGGNNGSAGSSDTTFTDGVSLTLTAGKGSGGPGTGAGGGPVFYTAFTINGGTATGGNINIRGGWGQPGMTLQNGSQAAAGGGGGSVLSVPQPALQNIGNNPGSDATSFGYGGGGGGGCTIGSGSGQRGGNGANGVIIIEEFYQ